MLLSVVQTRRNGARLTREEIEARAPVVGRLTIYDWREGNSAGRALRVARLNHPTISYSPELLLPLLDPALVRMTDAGFLLVGYEIESAGDRVAEHLQGWWVRALEGQM
jgi:hypothetical protein